MSEILRRATASDVAVLDHLMRSVSAYQSADAPMPADYALTAGQFERDIVVLAEVGGRPLGFYSLIIEGEPQLDLMFVADAVRHSDPQRVSDFPALTQGADFAVLFAAKPPWCETFPY